MAGCLGTEICYQDVASPYVPFILTSFSVLEAEYLKDLENGPSVSQLVFLAWFLHLSTGNS